MPERINFHALSVEPRRRETRSFRDARALGDREFTIQLEEPDANVEYQAADLARLILMRYVTGDPELPGSPFPFIVDGRAVALRPRLIDHACLIATMQPEPWDLPFDRYTVEDLLQMAIKARPLWDQLWLWVSGLLAQSEASLPNASTGREGDSSGPRSNGDTSIPASSPISVRPSGASTPASAEIRGRLSHPGGMTT